MEGLDLWVIQLCVCAAAVAAAENLLPEGNVKKSVYFILGLIVVTCFISPLENAETISFDFGSDDLGVSENTDWLNRMTEEKFSENIKILVEDFLDDSEIKAENIEIHTDINDENSISIDRVRITLSRDYSDRIDEIQEDIKRNLGLDADIIIKPA